MKKNIEWYPHRKDSHRHPKFKTLRSLYGGGNLGWSMEGRFWALNNIIADSEQCRIDLTKLRNKASLAEDLNLSLEELNQLIEHLISPDIELLFEVEENIFTTKKVSEALELSLVEREKARIRKGKSKSSGGKDKSSGEPSESSGENLTHDSKVKDSKVKDMTLNESKVKMGISQTQDSTSLPFTFLPDFNQSFFTEFEPYFPRDYTDVIHIKNKIEYLFTDYCIPPGKSELTRFANIVINTRGVKKQTAFNFLCKISKEFKSFPQEKQNYAYFSSVLEGKLRDAVESALKSEDRLKPANGNGLTDIMAAAEKLSYK